MQEVVVTHRGHLASEPTTSGEADSAVSFTPSHTKSRMAVWRCSHHSFIPDLHTLTKMCFALLGDTATVL